MPQFFIDRKMKAGEMVEVRGGDARHISQVLRLTRGDWLVLSDGDGRSFRANICTIGKTRVAAVIEEEVTKSQTALSPVMALSLIKGDRFEWAIQKLVELGTARIIPFYSSRTVPKYKQAVTAKKTARWEKIAIEAAKQSGLPFKPCIEPLISFNSLLKFSGEFVRTVLFYEGEEKESITSIWKNFPAHKTNDLLIIGPEGGFTDDEVKLALSKGILTVSLGTQILRCETAAIASLAIWQYKLGNMTS